MELDHFVIHVDPNPNLTQVISKQCASSSLEFDVNGDRNIDTFSAHYLYVGLEYLEIVQLKKPDLSGWVPQWIERYNRGVRGIYCLFLASDDIDATEKKLRTSGFDVKVERSSFVDSAGIEYPFPWRQIYMPPIPDTDVEISFIQYDSARPELREIFEPNSDKNGIDGISIAELSLPDLKKCRSFLQSIFSQIEDTPSGFKTKLENGDLYFRQSDKVSLHLTAKGAGHRFTPGEIHIANVTLETAFN